MSKYHTMNRIKILFALCGVALFVGCATPSAEEEKAEAARVVTDFYAHIQNHEFDSAMTLTNLSPEEASAMADLFGYMKMNIHEISVDSVSYEPKDTLALVHLSLMVSNEKVPDTATATPTIPCVKTKAGWRVKFDF